MFGKFNPLEWLNKTPGESKKAKTKHSSTLQLNDAQKQVENIISQIENQCTDITSSYANWRNIGFALSDSFGEIGRDYYHRISRFYTNYSSTECDNQYSNCLKAKGHGITLKTFFFLAKQAGINIGHGTEAASKKNARKEKVLATTLPDSIFSQLPVFLQKIISVTTSKEERDIMLLGSLVAISACLPKMYGTYSGSKLYPNLFLFITAQASAGKGRLVLCKLLVKQIHLELRSQSKKMKAQYEVDLAEYNANKGKESNMEKPQKAPEKMLFIPANNSSTGAYQLLSDSEGKGLIFETEGDTLAKAFKSDYGDYSDGFRKAFHHETIAYYRRTDKEYVEIESPKISAVLSGTPLQISSLIPTAENGLFSRFIFYYMNIQPDWKDVFKEITDDSLENYFEDLGSDFYDLYQALSKEAEVKFSFTSTQKAEFNRYFSQTQDKYLAIQGLNYMASIRRSAVIAFRIAMILSAIRIMDSGEIKSPLICEDSDFKIALKMIQTLMKHSHKVFLELPIAEKPKARKNRKQKFLEALPKNFNRQTYLEKAKSLDIPAKTAERYITQFIKSRLIHREKQDHYINFHNEETEESGETEETNPYNPQLPQDSYNLKVEQ